MMAASLVSRISPRASSVGGTGSTRFPTPDYQGQQETLPQFEGLVPLWEDNILLELQPKLAPEDRWFPADGPLEVRRDYTVDIPVYSAGNSVETGNVGVRFLV